MWQAIPFDSYLGSGFWLWIILTGQVSYVPTLRKLRYQVLWMTLRTMGRQAVSNYQLSWGIWVTLKNCPTVGKMLRPTN